MTWVVRGYGGTVDFAVEDGTTVTIRLPRADGECRLLGMGAPPQSDGHGYEAS